MTPLRVLIVTDAFPPRCGGSGWSTFELSKGLLGAGHLVDVVHVQANESDDVSSRTYEGLPVTAFGIRAPAVPFVRNLVKNERLWRRLQAFLTSRLETHPADVIHAQHVMTSVPSIRAGHARGVPVVVTVRDYWPVCYWSDLIYDPGQPQLCPRCSAGMMTRCLGPRAGIATPLAWPMIPYMRANLATKRQTLGAADAVIAVSSAIHRDLAARAPELDAARMRTIPNPFDMTALDAAYAGASRPRHGPYILYVGKLATNKGVQFLVPALVSSGVRLPVVAIGDGPLRADVERDARAHGIDLTLSSWLPRDEVWAWMRHATLLAFPSYGPESLSRVLVEAAALGVPIAAMSTGGTPDILTSGETALLSTDTGGLAGHLRQLVDDDSLRARLGAAARADVRERFEVAAVVARVEQVYRQVLPRRTA